MANLDAVKKELNSIASISDGIIAKREIEEWQESHPRAIKLLRKNKNFLVVSEDEPYFIAVYELIRSNELHNGTWTNEDEERYRAAQLLRAPDTSEQKETSELMTGEQFLKKMEEQIAENERKASLSNRSGRR